MMARMSLAIVFTWSLFVVGHASRNLRPHHKSHRAGHKNHHNRKAILRGMRPDVARSLAHSNVKHVKVHVDVVEDSSKVGIKCWSSDDLPVPDTETRCSDDEDRCLLRYVVGSDGAPKDGKVKRYCTSADACGTESVNVFESHNDAHGQTVVVNCCDSPLCNRGVPAQLANGLYWIKPDGSEKYVTFSNDELKEDGFLNSVAQKFTVTRVGGQYEGKYTIAPYGLDASGEWEILEVDSNSADQPVYTIIGQTKAGIGSIVGKGTPWSNTFVFIPTTTWEVGWRDKRCPKSRAFPSAKDPVTCQAECEKDAGCKEIIEWDAGNKRCFFVTDDCPLKDLKDGVGFVLYKSQCAGVVCQKIGPCHTVGTCDASNGQCSTPLMDAGAFCDDEDAMTVNDKCDAEGVCQGENLCEGVECKAETQCHENGTCDPKTGRCVEKFKAGGSVCDDGFEKTVQDTCNLGVCKGVDLCKNVECTAKDQCHRPGECNPKTGTCDTPAKSDGMECDDKNPDTEADKCYAGVCKGKAKDKCANVECPAISACHDKGECEEDTGMCTTPFKAEGEVCDDGSDITTEDKCDGKGNCAGVDKCADVVCSADTMDLNQCQNPGVCDGATGECTKVEKADGASCDDGDDETHNDVCTKGKCEGVDLCAAVHCTKINDCHDIGTCDKKTGQCSHPRKEDNFLCDDGNDFTKEDKCTAGVCQGIADGQKAEDSK